ncbi:MAG: hypothetical protein J6P03_07650, partial [Opitutales bacterium]|nr:hypothetical protein [Opitutales bacterium]
MKNKEQGIKKLGIELKIHSKLFLTRRQSYSPKARSQKSNRLYPLEDFNLFPPLRQALVNLYRRAVR